MIRFIIVAISIMLVILGLAHAVVFEALVSVFLITNPALILGLQIGLAVLGLSFIASFFICAKYNNVFSRILTTIASAWIGFLTYLFFASCIFGLTFWLLVLVFPIAPVLLFGKILILLAVLVGIYGIYNANNTRITSYSVSLPNLPNAWKNKKVVFISDMHLGQIRSQKFAERIVRKTQELKPDIIFNTGDLYDGVMVDPVAIIQPFENLKAPLGSYFVMGNHEEFRDNTKYFNAIQNAGMTVLNDKKVLVDGVQIIGADHKTTSKKPDFENMLQNVGIDKNQPVILLKHVPLNLETARDAGVSLQLSGHTHRAQIFPFMLLTKMMYKNFDYDLRSLGSLQVITTSGVGTWGPPLRVGTKSEIVVITFT